MFNMSNCWSFLAAESSLHFPFLSPWELITISKIILELSVSAVCCTSIHCILLIIQSFSQLLNILSTFWHQQVCRCLNQLPSIGKRPPAKSCEELCNCYDRRDCVKCRRLCNSGVCCFYSLRSYELPSERCCPFKAASTPLLKSVLILMYLTKQYSWLLINKRSLYFKCVASYCFCLGV